MSEHPELALKVAGWVKGAFRIFDDVTIEQLEERIRVRPQPEETFVLRENAIPVGCAGFRQHDLASRPDLTPWLTAVYVVPAYRRRGYASALVRHIEAFAQAQGVPTLWLYTLFSAPLYGRLGWRRVSLARDPKFVVVLMRRDLG